MVIPWENLDKKHNTFFIYSKRQFMRKGVCYMANCLIYGYAIPNGKIVYVGQTKQLYTRNKQHMDYDPYNQNNPEYNYPLSRGIRKHGKDYYSLIILEEHIPENKLDAREKYWIKHFDTYWNGYNQTMGGNVHGQREKYSDDVVNKVIDLLKNTSTSFNQIKELTGMSLTHIYNINIGERRYQENLIYPIRPHNAVGTRGIKFSQDEILTIHRLLASSEKTMKEIAAQFNCCPTTIKKINQGVRKCYALDGWNYPIR